MATLNVKNFPDDLYGHLQAEARRERRSLAQQVIHLLSSTVESSEPVSVLELKGLGKEIWQDVDAKRHVRAERASWD